MEQEIEKSSSVKKLYKPTQEEINQFLNEIISETKVPSNSNLFLTLKPSILEEEEDKETIFNELSYGFQLLGDLLKNNANNELRALAYYRSYQFNPENEELGNFFIRKKIFGPTPKTIEQALKD